MISLSIDDNNFSFSDEILKISTYLKDLYKDASMNESLPLLNVDVSTFKIFEKWFNILISEHEIVEYSYPFLHNFEDVVLGIVFKTEFFIDYDLETLIKLYNFGFYNQIILLCETVAYAISFRNIIGYTTLPNSFYIADISKQDFKKYNVSLSMLIMILNNMPDELFNFQPSETKKCINRCKRILYEYHTSLFKRHVLLDENFITVDSSKAYEIVHKFKNEYKTFYKNILKDDNKYVEKNIIVNYNVNTINTNVFNNIKVSSINIPNTVTYIDGYSFENCRSLRNINIPYTKRDLFKYIAFQDCPNLNLWYNRKIYKFSNSITAEEIPDYITDINPMCELPEHLKNVNIIKQSNLLHIDNSLTTFQVPDDIKRICNFAGVHCIELKNIELNNGLEYIGERAFFNCSKLQNITIPNTVTHIGDNCFDKCYNLKNIELSENLTSLGHSTFGECSSLKSINLKNINTINFMSFYECVNLENIYQNLNVLEPYYIKLEDILIRGNLFDYCVKLKSVDLSKCELDENIVFNGMFNRCFNLEYVKLPDNIVSIESEAFFKCSKLKTVSFGSLPDNVFPECLEFIGLVAFYECKSIENIVLPIKLNAIDSSVFKSCENLKHIGVYKGQQYNNVINDTLPCIGDIYKYTFYGCKNLKELTIPSSVNNIFEYAFGDCDIKLHIDKETNVDEKAFSN